MKEGDKEEARLILNDIHMQADVLDDLLEGSSYADELKELVEKIEEGLKL